MKKPLQTSWRKSVNGRPRSASAWRLAGAAALLAMVASCGQPGNGKNVDISLESAKTKVMSSEQEILGLLPGDAVLSTFAHDTSRLMPCTDGDRRRGC
jgi:hypothetical protein